MTPMRTDLIQIWNEIRTQHPSLSEQMMDVTHIVTTAGASFFLAAAQHGVVGALVGVVTSADMGILAYKIDNMMEALFPNMSPVLRRFEAGAVTLVFQGVVHDTILGGDSLSLALNRAAGRLLVFQAIPFGYRAIEWIGWCRREVSRILA